jgi:hypothetical protein
VDSSLARMILQESTIGVLCRRNGCHGHALLGRSLSTT